MQRTSGTSRVPNPQAALVEAQNAQRIARRRAAATLAASFAQTGRAGLGRGPRRQIGGVFETIQAVPKPRKQRSQQALSQSDVDRFLSAFRFDPSQQVLAESRTGQVLPRSLLAPGTEQRITNQRRTSTLIQPGLIGNFGATAQRGRTAANFNTGRGPFGGVLFRFGS